MHMRLNQQLWTYFERIGKKPNTIRKIFEQGRTPEFWLPSNDPGAAQLMYARNVAKAADMDMTEFFDAWGFFIPVSSFKLYAYGSFSYTVTQDMINQTLDYMKNSPLNVRLLNTLKTEDTRQGPKAIKRYIRRWRRCRVFRNIPEQCKNHQTCKLYCFRKRIHCD